MAERCHALYVRQVHGGEVRVLKVWDGYRKGDLAAEPHPQSFISRHHPQDGGRCGSRGYGKGSGKGSDPRR